MLRRSPHVALLGSRGIPASYGGYETLMEELAPRLVAAGFEVTVYCRAHYTPRTLREHRGAHLRVLPTLRTRHLDTPVHTLLSCLDVLARPEAHVDAALVVNGANALFLPLLSLAGVATALHVDGIERQRGKWGPLGRSVYALSERLACVLPDVLVTDAEVIRAYYRERYGAESIPIAYGVDPRPPVGRETLDRLGLRDRRYFLYVSRFEPENNPHRVVEAYRRVGGDLPLVMVGGAPYARRFIDEMRSRADARVRFPGPIYGEGYRQLQSQALAYVHATEVGGTHPALVEAMGYGNCVLVNDAPENREVAGAAGRYFRADRPETLAALLEEVRREPEAAREWGRKAALRAAERYSWDRVAERYAELFRSMIAGFRTRRRGIT
jgi:glycosyltransferase involved in cell wall biosynthesis